MTFSAQINSKNIEKKEYNVEKLENNCELNKIVTTPIYTLIDYKNPDDSVIIVKDNFGNEIEKINAQENKYIFETLIEGTTSIIVNVPAIK